MSLLRDTHRTIFLIALLTLIPVHAGVYKYQDENGKWHFTDKPPEGQNSTAVSTTTTGNGSSSGASKGDLKDLLHQKYNPTTPIDAASLSVVTVQTKAGSGSGFFVTEDGYIITNRHVVRPSTSTQSKDMEQQLKQREEQLAGYKRELKHDKEIIREQKKKIDQHRAYMESDSASQNEKDNYASYVRRYARNKERYDEKVKSYKRLEKEYKEVKSEHGFSTNISNFSKKFVVVLKDGKKLKARLVKISKKHDLALLKLDHYTTPFLSLAKQNYPRQGTKVFAIGSPLGISDALTTGIVTKPDRNFLITDARILPGNSGGPLVNDDGTVLGVNTAIVTDQNLAEGLGLAVYSMHIRQEFARELGGKI